MLSNNNNNDLSIPEWKKALLERRRQQQSDPAETDDESARLAEMPAWKRDIWLRKRQQKRDSGEFTDKSNGSVEAASGTGLVRTPAFRASATDPVLNAKLGNESSNRFQNRPAVGEFDYSVVPKTEVTEGGERLLPIQRNPILRSDFEKRSNSRDRDRNLNRDNPDNVIDDVVASVGKSNGWSIGHWPNSDDRRKGEGEEEEVVYGTGFVSTLLGRFRELSERNHDGRVAPRDFRRHKRTCSSDDILRDVDADADADASTMTRQSARTYSSNSGSLKNSKMRARSMENIFVEDFPDVGGRRNGERPLSVPNGAVLLKVPSGAERRKSTEATKTNRTTPVSGVAETGSGGGKALVPPRKTRESSPVREEETPRKNVVLLTRTVFESICTSPSPIESALKSPRGRPSFEGSSPKSETNSNSPAERKLETNSNSPVERRSETKVTRPPSPIVESNRTPDRDLHPPLTDVIESATARSSPRSRSNLVADSTPSSEKSSSGGREPASEVVVQPKLSSHVNVPTPASISSVLESEKVGTAGSMNGYEKRVTYLSRISKFEEKPEKTLNGLVAHAVEKKRETSPGTSNSTLSSVPSRQPSSTGTVKPEDAAKPRLITDLEQLPTKVSQPTTSKNTDKRSVTRDDGGSRGPGSLLIRPASNLVTSSVKAEYLNLTKYNDVKTGEFAPPKRRPSYYDGDGDVPVTNLDDVMDDDEVDSRNGNRYAPKEGDPSLCVNHRTAMNYVFEGAGVTVGRSLLAKSNDRKEMRIRFDGSSPEVYEYPSEEWLIEDMTEEEDEKMESRSPTSTSSLLSVPGIGGSTGSLSSYKSRIQVEYQIGVERSDDDEDRSKTTTSPRQQAPPPTKDTKEEEAKVTDTWSRSASSDLLF